MMWCQLRKGHYLDAPLNLDLGVRNRNSRDSKCENDFDGGRFSIDGFEMDGTTEQGTQVDFKNREYISAERQEEENGLSPKT